MQSKVVIFDLDGVLFDTIPFQMNHLKEHYPMITEDKWKDLSKGNFYDTWEGFTDSLPADFLHPTENIWRKKSFVEQKCELPVFEGMIELIDRLHRRGCKIALNTSAHDDNCLPMLEKCGLDKMFNFVGTAEISKSKVEKFRLISEKYNVPRENMVFVTDTIGDILEAEESNIPTIAVTWGLHTREDFAGEYSNLIAIVDTVDELESKL